MNLTSRLASIVTAAFGIVLAAGRPAEVGHDAVAHEARDVAAHLPHRFRRGCMVAVEDRHQLFRIEAMGELR